MRGCRSFLCRNADFASAPFPFIDRQRWPLSTKSLFYSLPQHPLRLSCQYSAKIHDPSILTYPYTHTHHNASDASPGIQKAATDICATRCLR